MEYKRPNGDLAHGYFYMKCEEPISTMGPELVKQLIELNKAETMV